MFIWKSLPNDVLFVFTATQSALSLSCGSCSDIAWDRLTALWGSICDYSLQRHFQKSASLLDPPDALALFCFLSFGVFNVIQHDIMEKGILKAPLPPAGWPSRALVPSGGPNPVCLSVAQRMHLQLCWVERKITAVIFSFSFFFFLVYFNQCPPSSSSHPLPHTVELLFYFMVFWVAQDQLFSRFVLFRAENNSLESSAAMWFVAVHPFNLDSTAQSSPSLSQYEKEAEKQFLSFFPQKWGVLFNLSLQVYLEKFFFFSSNYFLKLSISLLKCFLMQTFAGAGTWKLKSICIDWHTCGSYWRAGLGSDGGENRLCCRAPVA